MDHKLQMVGIHSHLEMGPMDDGSHVLDNGSLFTPDTKTQKTHSRQHLTFTPGQREFNIRNWKISLFRSINTVVFATNLNLLMPFGPLAIIVHKLSGHNGWVFFFSLLGITPLAERLGYATENYMEMHCSYNNRGYWVGVLSLAWSISQLGWIAGPVSVLCFAIVTYISVLLLTDCYRSPHPVTRTRNYCYMDAVRVNLGRKQMWACGFLPHLSKFYLHV